MKANFRRWYFLALGLIAITCAPARKALAREDALDKWTQSQIDTNSPGIIGFYVIRALYGNGMYVAVGSYAGMFGAAIQTSVDGLNWTVRSSSAGPVSQLYDLAYGNGTFVAVGANLANGCNIFHSTNGADWTSHQSAILDLYGIAYGNNTFVAVGDGYLMPFGLEITNRNIYTSPDGITWTAQDSGSPTNEAQPIWSIAYGAGRFVAVDAGQHFYTSDSGTDWSRTTDTRLLAAPILPSLTFCKDRFFALSGLGSNLVSSDGLSWTLLTNDTGCTFFNVQYGDGFFVASGGTNSLFISQDGTNWSRRTLPVAPNVTVGINLYANRRFLGLGSYKVGVTNIPVAYLSDPIVGASVSPGFPPIVNVSGVSGRTYRIEQLDNLNSTNWQTVTNFVLTNSPTIWTDSQATNASRYYRAVLLP